MTTLNQIRGMLLEECLLVLLRAGGYVPVLTAGKDPTLCDGKSGLECRGRGGVHQLDAVADHRIRLPFINPQRLLLEAKCYQHDKVGLDVVRNAVGVLKDVSEWWVPAKRPGEMRSRFHYTYAIASGTGFSIAAQRYAFAQDVYLLALKGVRCFAGVLQPIRELSAASFGATDPLRVPIDLGALRRTVRGLLASRQPYTRPEIAPGTGPALARIVAATRRVGGAMIGVAPGGFSVILVPVHARVIDQLGARTPVRIMWDDQGWWLENSDGQRLFDFDLPEHLFRMYQRSGVLEEEAALDLKQRELSGFVAARVRHGVPEVVHLELDAEWLEQLRRERRSR